MKIRAVIFLDIDGVLCTPESYASHSGSHANAAPRCVNALNDIIAATGASIVLSSTWRHEGLMFMREKLAEWGVVREGKVGALVDATTWPPMTTREAEIMEWLDGSGAHYGIEAFAILDDEGMDRLKRYAVQVNGSIGLSAADALLAIRIING